MPRVAKQVLVVDAQVAGVSGDMMVAALLDLGADTTRVTDAMRTPRQSLTGCDHLDVAVSDVTRNGIRAKRVEVSVSERTPHRTAGDLLDAAASCVASQRLSARAKRFALNAIGTIVSAEERVHGQTGRGLHLHETASADTLADVIGCATALDDLKLFNNTIAYSTPVALGGGALHFSHGRVSSPAPAALEILRSGAFLTTGGPVEAELATPTGVSLLTSLSHRSVRFYPPMKPTKVGYGAGKADFAEMPNVLRIVLGQPLDLGLAKDEVYVIETNLDDASGELVGHAMQRLLDDGSRDVAAIPILTKKGRPGHILKVIADASCVGPLSRTLIEETGTLGVRIHPSQRYVLPRESFPVELVIDDIPRVIRVKIAKNTAGDVLQIKPEYDDVHKLAEETGNPFRQIHDTVKARAGELLQERRTHEDR